MPFVSPRGLIKTKAPESKPNKPAETKQSAQSEDVEVKAHEASAALGEVNARDRDPSVVEGLEMWKGWSWKDGSGEEREDVDPLEETPAMDLAGEKGVGEVRIVIGEVEVGGVDVDVDG